jgi:hypothetical protein
MCIWMQIVNITYTIHMKYKHVCKCIRVCVFLLEGVCIHFYHANVYYVYEFTHTY